jgi:hypothetical protein
MRCSSGKAQRRPADVLARAGIQSHQLAIHCRMLYPRMVRQCIVVKLLFASREDRFSVDCKLAEMDCAICSQVARTPLNTLREHSRYAGKDKDPGMN